MSLLYEGLLKDSSLKFSQEQSQLIVNFFVQLFIVARMVWAAIYGLKFLIPQESKVEGKRRLNNFLKQVLFGLLVTSSSYLRIESIIQITSAGKLSDQIIYSGVSWFSCFIIMTVCIRLFWKRLNKQMIIQGITSEESLETDICATKVVFSNDWSAFIRVLEVGIVYRYSQSGNLYYNNRKQQPYITNSNTQLKQTVSIAMEYSTITQELGRLNAPMMIYKKQN